MPSPRQDANASPLVAMTWKSNAIPPRRDARRHALNLPDLQQAAANRVHLDAARDKIGRRRESDLPQCDRARSSGVRVARSARSRARVVRHTSARRSQSSGDRRRMSPCERRRGDDLLQRVDAVHQRIERPVDRTISPLANRAQTALHLVREPLGFAQLHHRRDALQRMKAPEQFFDDRRRRVGAPMAASSASRLRRTAIRCSSHSAK